MSNGGWLIDFWQPPKLIQHTYVTVPIHKLHVGQSITSELFLCYLCKCMYNTLLQTSLPKQGHDLWANSVRYTRENMSRMVCNCNNSNTYFWLRTPSAKLDIFGWRPVYWLNGITQWLMTSETASELLDTYIMTNQTQSQ